MKTLPEKFGAYKQYEAIKLALQNSVYNSLSPSEFETSWKNMIEKYELQDKEWLIPLYDEMRR